MSAKRFVDANVKRFLEGAYQLRGVESCALRRADIAGIRAKITVAFLVRREDRGISSEVDDHIAFGSRAVPGR
jgi:hypothetical protein